MAESTRDINLGNDSQDKLSSSASPAKRNILIIDDNTDAALSLKMLLEISGHVVRVSSDGPSGLAQALNFKPDTVLLDIGLPGMDGYAVAKQLRANVGTTGALIVAITGYGQIEDRQRSRNNGLDHHLTKPVDFEQLEQILR